MPEELRKLAEEVADGGDVDGYTLWRALKDLNNEIYRLERSGLPIPIELARTRAVLVKAQRAC